MKLSNRTVLIIGNELTFKISLINHFLELNNKIVIVAHVEEVCNYINSMFPSVTLIQLNIYNDTERMKITEELSFRYLSPSCIIYNEAFLPLYSYSDEFFLGRQYELESYFTAIMDLDNHLLTYIETEADATLAYILPKLSWSTRKSRKLKYIIVQTIINYIIIMQKNYKNISFIPIYIPSKHIALQKPKSLPARTILKLNVLAQKVLEKL